MIIAISGKKQIGKDTFGKMLLYLIAQIKENKESIFKKDINYINFENWYNKIHLTFKENYINEIYAYNLCNFKIKKFATDLKKITAILLGCEENDFEKEEFKKKKLPEIWGKNHSYRDILIYIGTIFRKYYCEYTWINSLFKNYNPKKDNWIITDLRFKNEADYLLNKNAILIRINKNQNEIDTNQSETDLDEYMNFHHYINNNGTLEELFEEAKKIIQTIKL